MRDTSSTRPRRIRPDSQRKRQKAETRARVLSAARAVFRDQGYDASTVKDIADRADVAVGSVFSHFDSKAELLAALALETLHTAVARMHEAVRAHDDPIDQIEAAVFCAYEVNFANRALIGPVHSASWVWSRETEDAARAALRPAVALISQVLEDGVRAGVLPPDLDIVTAVWLIDAGYTSTIRDLVYRDAERPALSARIRTVIRAAIFGARTNA